MEGRPLPSCREEIADKVYAIGSLTRLDLNEQTNSVVLDLLGPILTAHKFKRLWKHGTMYQCIDYLSTTKRNSYTVEFSRNGHLEFGEVQYFLKCSQPCEHSAYCEISCDCNRNQYIAILQLLECNHNIHISKDKFTNAMVDHIVPVAKKKGAYVAASVVDIMSMCVSVRISDGADVNFVCKLPNRFEKD